MNTTSTQIDRVSSAWLIQKFVAPKARFIFGPDSKASPEAIPFDMFCTEGFGHGGEDCTFETLCKQLSIRESRVKGISEIIHHADLNDDKFGRSEGAGWDKVLNGWTKQDMPNNELLNQ